MGGEEAVGLQGKAVIVQRDDHLRLVLPGFPVAVAAHAVRASWHDPSMLAQFGIDVSPRQVGDAEFAEIEAPFRIVFDHDDVRSRELVTPRLQELANAVFADRWNNDRRLRFGHPRPSYAAVALFG